MARTLPILGRRASCAILIVAVLLAAPHAKSDVSAPHPGTQTAKSKHAFDVLLERLERSIEGNRMGLVAQASASRGAAARGVTIPGNAVFMVFRNDFAVRMLAASVAAGIEAPIRIYVTENADGAASITYRIPSAVFAPYKNPELDVLARELDPIFARIVRDALGD